MYQITIGYDVRHWATIEVVDLTADELATVAGDDSASVDLLLAMNRAKRLQIVGETQDDAPEMFSTAIATAVLDVVPIDPRTAEGNWDELDDEQTVGDRDG